MPYFLNKNSSTDLINLVRINLRIKPECVKPPSLVRSNSTSSVESNKIYYNADANVSHRTVPHDRYSIQRDCGNAIMSSPIYANYN